MQTVVDRKMLNRALPPLALALSLAVAGSASAGDPQDQWWERLQALCGKAYAGQLVRAPEGDDTFRDRNVVIHVRDCSSNRVRIPLVIDDDRSRTWVLSRSADGIELRHDHRQADGSPDTVTMYGGITSNTGSADTQMFAADDQTREVIPGSGQRSVWLMEIHPDGRFVYAGNRVGTERGFQVDFDLSRAVPAPEAPWGWED
ncbi:hypothetical protein [Luteimonas sp. A478]